MANIITAGNSTNGGTQITTDTSGTLNIVTGSGSGANAITIDASQAVVMPGNLTVSGTLIASSGVTGAITSGTAVSASGTSVTFTGIPSTAKRITVMFSGVSTNGTSNWQLQLGSGSITTTGYAGAVATFNSSPTVTNATTGFVIASALAAITLSGTVVFTNVSGNIWVASGYLSRTDGGTAYGTGGNITLSGTLDRVRITTVNGTDTFDAGTINIFYE